MTPARQTDARQRAKLAVQDFLRWQATRKLRPDADDLLPEYVPDEIICANLPRTNLRGTRG
jgi:hypothetical protein